MANKDSEVPVQLKDVLIGVQQGQFERVKFYIKYTLRRLPGGIFTKARKEVAIESYM